MKRQLIQKLAFFLCALMVVLAPLARSQEQSNAASQARTNSGKALSKEEEPETNTAAATEALQKATQNPVASLISVPVQNNTNFGVNPGYRTQDILNIQPVVPIGIAKDWNMLVRWIAANRLSTCAQPTGSSRNRGVWIGRHAAHIFHITEEAGEMDLGSRSNLPVAYSNKHVSGTGEVGHGPIGRSADATGPLDHRGTGKQCLVGGGLGRPSGCESVSAAVLHQLQLEKGLVYHLAAHSDSELGGCEWQSMDGAVWRRSGKNHETRIPTRVTYRPVLW